MLVDCTKRRDAYALGVSVFNALALTLIPTVGACDTKADPKGQAGVQYGDPVGIELGAHGAVPALAIKVAVSKGRDPSASVTLILLA